ncbi:hypothetical protein L1887_49186 [Cichorium endivia]|nr:hypothetical protein L1887_49186 [Cichorium endivia]
MHLPRGLALTRSLPLSPHWLLSSTACSPVVGWRRDLACSCLASPPVQLARTRRVLVLTHARQQVFAASPLSSCLSAHQMRALKTEPSLTGLLCRFFGTRRAGRQTTANSYCGHAESHSRGASRPVVPACMDTHILPSRNEPDAEVL